jgi:preprotein translocase subunit SecE
VIALSIFLYMIDFVFEKVFEFLVNLGTK